MELSVQRCEAKVGNDGRNSVCARGLLRECQTSLCVQENGKCVLRGLTWNASSFVLWESLLPPLLEDAERGLLCGVWCRMCT